MIFQRVYAAKTIVLSFSVANAEGSNPVVGFSEEVEKLWEKIKQQLNVNKKPRGKLSVDRSSSSVELQKLNREQHRRPSEVSLRLAKFKAIDKAAQAAILEDVYSPYWTPPKFDKSDPNYGRPKAGSLTEQRGIAAGVHIGKEIIKLCEVIDEHGDKNEDGTVTITFGKLFSVYVYISDKVVGMLIRARKHKMVDFVGEMLYQRQDDHVPVTLMQPLEEVRRAYSQSKDPASCLTSL